MKSQNSYTITEAKKSWQILDQAIDTIFDDNIYKLSYQELYSHAYNLILNRFGDFTYKNLTQSLSRIFQKLLSNSILHDQNLLENILECWDKAKIIIETIKKIFLYMEKNYIMPDFYKSVKPIKVLGYEIFHFVLYTQNKNISDKILNLMVDQIRADRLGEKINGQLFKQIISMLVEFGIYAILTTSQKNYQTIQIFMYEYNKEIYKLNFEDKYLEETKYYYRTQSLMYLKQMNITEYINITTQRLQEEKNRVQEYLDPSSHQLVVNVFLQQFIGDHVIQILDSESGGLNFLIRNCLIQDLKRMHLLFFQHTPSYNLMKQQFFQFIKDEGKFLILQSEQVNNNDLIDMLLKFKEDIEKIVQESFVQSNAEICQTLLRQTKESFEQFINSSDYVSISLVQYIDESFKKGFRYIDDEEIEVQLNRLFGIFRLILDKDVFKHHYKKMLAYRIVHEQSVNNVMEGYLISKLKLECGPMYTNKLETMFKDVTNSKILNSEFKEKYSHSSIDFEVSVYTAGHWPFQEEQNSIIFPENLQYFIRNFQTFYLHKKPQTKLMYYPSLGVAFIKAFYKNNQKKEIQLSTIQMLCLLLFNDHDKLSLEQINQYTKINQQILSNNLQPLVKKKILACSSFQECLGMTDIVCYNPDFTDKAHKIKVSIKQMNKEKQQNKEIDNKEVYIERKYLVDSIIVKILKYRKNISHLDLVNEVKKIAKNINHFLPPNKLIKIQIEDLINREYIKRSGPQGEMYSYIA